MKRTGISRKHPLRPSVATPERAKALKPRNEKRAQRLRAEQFGTDGYREWLMSLPCATCGLPARANPDGKSAASHIGRTRGAGGRQYDMAPQCWSNPATGYRGCHDLLAEYGNRTFEVAMRCDLRALAASTWKRWQERQSGA